MQASARSNGLALSAPAASMLRQLMQHSRLSTCLGSSSPCLPAPPQCAGTGRSASGGSVQPTGKRNGAYCGKLTSAKAPCWTGNADAGKLHDSEAALNPCPDQGKQLHDSKAALTHFVFKVSRFPPAQAYLLVPWAPGPAWCVSSLQRSAHMRRLCC